jgi:zinc/manganese transport system substrate-binding protein
VTACASLAGELRVCCTVPDLADLVRRIGGEAVVVTAFVQGGEDPHHLDARPSHIAALARARLLVEVGCELEIGWLPAVVAQARNPGLRRLVAADHVRLLGIPTRPVDRSHGDVHSAGNPHFLCDPWRGLQVARAIAEILGDLAGDPQPFRTACRRLEDDILGRLAGTVDRTALVAALDRGEVPAQAAGWFARLAGLRGRAVVADHDLWPYLAERYGFRVAALLEPKPGLPPTQNHLAAVIAQVQADSSVAAILTVPFFDPRHARQVATATRLPVLRLPNQVGATTAATDWPAMLEAQIEILAGAIHP